MRQVARRGMLTEHACSGLAYARCPVQPRWNHLLASVALRATLDLRPHPGRPPVPAFAAVATAGLALSAAAVAVALTGAGPEPRALAAIVHALVIAAPIGAGLYALYSQPASAGRFGRLLVLSGFLWSPTMLAESADSVLYSVGRISAWSAEALLIYVVLAYPSGRLAGRAEKLLFRAAAVTVGVLYLPTSLLVEQYPVPTPWSSCGSDCPPNAFQAIGSEPGFIDSFLIPFAQVTTTVIFAAVTLVLALRLLRGSRLTRVGLLPVLVVAIVRMAAATAFMVARRDSRTRS